jgi:hypothetical protein
MNAPVEKGILDVFRMEAGFGWQQEDLLLVLWLWRAIEIFLLADYLCRVSKAEFSLHGLYYLALPI